MCLCENNPFLLNHELSKNLVNSQVFKKSNSG